jgi:RHH-type proline utilization regulon transcriptional repressor/proline dehydrogenase/delta 1-pyrroline-5-carboxylate dehydrogenase
VPLPAGLDAGTFVAPTIIEIDDIADLRREVFGPVLHVVRYRRERLDALIDAINATGYGLTFGLHTRLDETIARVTARVQAGNLYINRNVIGAIVGVQPFGGRGLSGTGPKAGGPLYLGRLVQTAPATDAPRAQTPAPLRDFAAWLDAGGDAAGAALARRYGDEALTGVAVELPGPVGERNVYALHPRGRVLMAPATRAGLVEQMAAVLATGNRGEVDGMALPPGLPASVAAAFAPDNTPCTAALVESEGDHVAAMLARVAGRPGPIVPVHAARTDRRLAYDPVWLVEEVATSINTTAAGGNASLMMIG